jgi:hypothetical protein
LHSSYVLLFIFCFILERCEIWAEGLLNPVQCFFFFFFFFKYVLLVPRVELHINAPCVLYSGS